MKDTLIVVICLVVLVALVALCARDAAVERLRAACAAGKADAGICWVAERGGLFATPEATPARLPGQAAAASDE